MRAALTIAALGAVLSAPSVAHACASCACGDPTLTAMDREIPFAGRWRVAALASLRSESAGVPRSTEIRASEQRLTLALSWSPLDALTVAIAVPAVRRDATEVSGRRHQGYGLGDLELRARWSWSAGGPSLRHMLSLHGGLDVPTTPELASLPIEAQPSSGALSGIAGVGYGLFAWPWSVYASASARASTEGHADVTPGRALLFTLSGQLQLSPSFAASISADARLDAPASEHGGDDPHSGGFLAMLTPTLRWSPVTDWMIGAGARIPVIAALRGVHSEGVTGILEVTCDL